MKTMLPRLLAAALAVLVAGPAALAWAQAQQPTLADIARQRRAEKANKKVITSEEMKTAEAPAAPAAEAAAAEGGEAAAPPHDEALAAAQAKVDDLTDRVAFLNRNIERFQASVVQATEANDEGKKRMFEESLESARQNLANSTEALAAAHKELEEKKAAAAAAAAPKTKKRPARKPAAPKA